jgi:hypothetical protein
VVLTVQRGTESRVLIVHDFTPHLAAPMICALSYGVNSFCLGIFPEISPKGQRGLAIMLNIDQR